MSGSSKNTSQDPEYVGPTGHEKKIHKTHFPVNFGSSKMYDFANDPDYEQVVIRGVRVWRKKNDSRSKET